jgi:hypothetical protein
MKSRVVALVLGALLASSSSTAAQTISAGLRGGVTFPVGSYGDSGSTISTGWNVGATARVDFGSSRFGFQIDVGYSGNKIDGPPFGEISDWQGGIALLFRILPITSPIRPYVLAGAGIDYWQDNSGNGLVPAFYGAGGVDLRLDPIEPYVEVQYRNVMTPGPNLRTVQLMFGVRYILGYR